MRHLISVVAISLSAWLTSMAHATDRDEELCKRSKDERQGIAACSRLIDRGRGSASIYKTRGTCYSLIGVYDRAIADHNEAIRLDPKDISNYTMRGLTFNRTGDYRRAIADYTTAIRLAEDEYKDNKNRNRYLSALYWFHGGFYESVGDLREAVADYTRAIRLAREHYEKIDQSRMFREHVARMYEKRSKTYKGLGDQPRAAADHEEASRLDPNVGKD